MGKLMARYRDGEHEAVWREIRSHQSIDGALRDEALEVAEDTMRRVARNADLLAHRLESEGWIALSGKLRTGPSPEDPKMFERIEAATQGPLPPALRAFWTVVGGIDFVWDYDCGSSRPDLGVGLTLDEMDPLCVDPAQCAEEMFELWEFPEDEAGPDPKQPQDLYLAPDRLHKMNVSGGPPYSIRLPFFGADPVFAHEPHGLPFIDYLRLCFRWAGFPGLEEHGDREDVQIFLRRFGQDMEPF